MTPMTRPAARTLKVLTPTPMSFRSGVKKVRAKKPNTTVGMPASTSSAGFRNPRTRGAAYSLR